MVDNWSVGSVEIQAGGDLTGGGYMVSCDNKNGAGYAFDNDGTITGDLDLELSGPDTSLDLVGTGNIRNLTSISANTVIFVGNTTITGSLGVYSGPFRPSATTDTLTIGGNLQTSGTFGLAGWDADLNVAGDLTISGTYTHGNQDITLNGAAGQAILASLSCYSLILSNANTTTAGAITIASEAGISINGGCTLNTTGTTLVIGTGAASGEIDNSGTIEFGDGTKVYAADAGFLVDVHGAGIYDWDYGTGTIYWKWLIHSGTNPTAKTTGSGGVIVVLDGPCSFNEDFTIAVNDTMSCGGYAISIKKDFTVAGTLTNGGALYLLSGGTGLFSGYSGTSLTIFTDLTYSFYGTNTFSGSVTWDGASVGSLLVYDATGVLTVTGGITVPATAYLGADVLGAMDDGNPVSGWTTAQSWGWLNNAGIVTLPRAILTMPSHSGGNVLVNSGTLTHNNCIIKLTSTTAHQAIDSGGDVLYRVNNQNTFVATVTFTASLSLDGIFFSEGTITEAANGVTVTLTGFTPALGSVGPFTHDELEATGRLLETGTGVFVFEHELAEDMAPGLYRVMYTTADTEQENVVDVWFKDAMDRYSREAEILLDDPDGSQAANYTTGDPVRILYHDGTEWLTRWRGYCEDIDDGERQSPFARIRCYGFDAWLRKRKVSASFTHRNHTLLEVLEVLITSFSPITWDSALIDTSLNPATLTPIFQNVNLDEAISNMLGESDNEEYFVDDDFKFNVRQRATAFDGTYDAPVTYDDDNVTSAELETMGSDEINRVVVPYDTNLDKVVVAQDTTRQTALQTQTGASQPVIIEATYSRPDLKALTDAQAYASYRLNSGRTYLKGTIETYDSENVYPGMITQLTLADKTGYAIAVDMKVLETSYQKTQDRTVLLLVEAALDKPRYNPLGVNNRMDNVQKSLEKVDGQRADNQETVQSQAWDNQADFNLWTLGANQATNIAGYIECSGATVGIETCTSPWVIPGTGTFYVFFWDLLKHIKEDNDGTIAVQVEGSVSGIVPFTNDWSSLRASFLNTENLRMNITFNWAGAGTSPKFYFASLGWK